MLKDQWMIIAQQELGETPDKIHLGLAGLKQLITENELKHSELICDDFLVRFLRARKFKTEDAFKMLQRYCDVKQKFPLNELIIRRVMNQHLSFVLPHKDQLGRGVFIFRAGKWDPATCSLWDIFQANLACLELLVQDTVTQVCGIVAIVDMAGLGLCQARHVTPNYAREVIALLQDCFPLRFKAIHFVNEPRLFCLIYSIIKPFLTEKLTKRFYFHGRDQASVHRYLSRDILPSEYGGTCGHFSSDQTFAQIQKMMTIP